MVKDGGCCGDEGGSNGDARGRGRRGTQSLSEA